MVDLGLANTTMFRPVFAGIHTASAARVLGTLEIILGPARWRSKGKMNF